MSGSSRWLLLGTLCLLPSTSASAQSAYISLTGEFPTVGDQHDFYFDLSRSVASSEELRFETFANGGGTNAAGEVISSGGIDSVLELFDSGGGHHGLNDDGSFTPGTDSLLSWPGIAQSDDAPLNPIPLPAASYRLNLSEYNNDAAGTWALDLVGPSDALVFTGASPNDASPPSVLNTLTVGNGAQVSFTGHYDLQNNQTFAFQSGANFTLEDYLDIGKGSPGTLIVENPGTMLTTNTTSDTYLYWGRAGATAQVYVRTGASADFQATRIDIAADTNPGSAGALWVDSGANVTANTLNVGTGAGSGTGQIVLLGEGSTITQNGTSELTVGATSGGVDDFLSVTDHAEFNSGTGAIRVNPSGYMVVDDATFNANGPLNVASTGPPGSYGVWVGNEGQISSQDVLVRGIGTFDYGSILVNGFTPGAGVRTHWDITGSLDIGTGLGGGNVQIVNNGLVNVSQDVTVLSDPDATGTLIVTSNGELDVNGQLHLALAGLVNLDGGTITTHSLVVDDLATLYHKDGALTVDGGTFDPGMGDYVVSGEAVGDLPRFVLTNAATGSIVGHLSVGERYPGEMSIENGAALTVVQDVRLPSTSPSANGMGTSSITVRGNGSRLIVSGPQSFGSASLYVGSIGTGKLIVEQQGVVEIQQGGLYLGVCGDFNVCSGEIVVDGAGSRIDAEYLQLRSEGLPNSVHIRNGGVMTAKDSAQMNYIIPANTTEPIVVEVGDENSLLDTYGALTVEGGIYGAPAVLNVAGGGTVRIRNHLMVNSPLMGFGSGPGPASLNVDGTGGIPTTVLVDGSIFVGGDSSSPGSAAHLTVSNGAQTTVGDTLKIWPAGTVQLTNPGSEIHTGSFLVEPGGTFTHEGGTLIVDGGEFQPVQAGSDYEIAGPDNPLVELRNHASNSTLPANVSVGRSLDGALHIHSGASLDLAGDMFVGVLNGSFGSPAVLDVDGTDSKLNIGGDLEVGNAGAGEMSVSGGAVVDSSGIGSFGRDVIGNDPGGGHSTALVIGTGSRWDTNMLVVGEEGSGALDIRGGTVNTTGDAFIGRLPGSSSSSVTVTAGPGPATWNISQTLWVGGGTNAEGAGASGDLSIGDGGVVDVGSHFKVWPTGRVYLGNGTIRVPNQYVNLADGDLWNSGTTGTVEGELRNNGTVVLSVSLSEAGILTVTSDYDQSSSSGLVAYLYGDGGVPGDDFDQLNVLGNATLDGGLTVVLQKFTPSAGDTFEILTAGELLGTFSTESLPSIPGKPGLRFLIDYDTTLDRVLLSVAPYFEADFDEDLDVDGDDLAIWQAGYAIGTMHTEGDADGDGDVDGNDYLIWQRQLGSGGGGSLNAVPEPATWIPLLMGITTCIFATGRAAAR